MVENLQDRINGLRPYFRGIEMYNDALIVKMQYPPKWKCYGSVDERIKVTNDERDPNFVYYYGDSNNTSYEEMFTLIEETVRVNQDMKLKLALLKEKFEELKELFSNKPYEELQTLRFSFEPIQKGKPKRKYTRRKKTQQNENNEAIEASAEQPVEKEDEQ